MDIFSNLMAVAVVSLLGAISPGPDFFVVVRNSLSYSRKMGFLTVVGIHIALFVHLFYTMTGLGILVSEGSVVYSLLKYGGAAYLFYLGCKGLIASFKQQTSLELQFAGIPHTITSAMAFRQGFLTNLLNPKCMVFFISFFSQFIDANTPLSLKLGYASINWAVSFAWFLLLSYMITGQALMSRINTFRIYIDRIMGCALMLLSLKLLLS